jgi:hypothetical protein
VELVDRTFVQLSIRVLFLVSGFNCYSWPGVRLGDAIFLFCEFKVSVKLVDRTFAQLSITVLFLVSGSSYSY